MVGKGVYEARIACNLWSKDGVGRYDSGNPKKRLESHPYFTQSGKDRMKDGDQYIANMRDGAVAGFKYFQFENLSKISVTTKGTANGMLFVYTDKYLANPAVAIPVSGSKKPKVTEASIIVADGVYPLYFKFVGTGAMDFIAFELC